MIARSVIAAACLLAAAAFVGAILWPAAALLIQCFNEGKPADPQILGARHLLLLARTLLLVGVSTFLSIVIGLAVAPALAGRHRRFALIVCLVVLFCPPMVYAFGWQRVLPAGIDPHIACVLVWSLWSWPIAAMIVSGGFSGVRSSYEAALLSTSRAGAYLRIVVPGVMPQIVLSAFAIGALLLGEYTTPHANGLVVYATELLGWATSSPDVIDTCIAAIPLLGIMVGLIGGMFLLIRGHRSSDSENSGLNPGRRSHLSLVALLCLISAGLPLAALVLKLSGLGAIAGAAHTYGRDILSSVMVAAAAAVCTIALAIGSAYFARVSKSLVLFIWVTMLFGIVPGALVGEALIAAYNRPALAWVYDQWPIVTLAYVARFAWLGALAGWLLRRDLYGEPGSQAAVDGASLADALFHVVLPQHLMLLGGVGMIVLALSLAEVASTSMVRVPTFSPISQVIIEKFHRFEDDMLISLSLLLIAASVAGALMLGRVLRDER